MNTIPTITKIRITVTTRMFIYLFFRYHFNINRIHRVRTRLGKSLALHLLNRHEQRYRLTSHGQELQEKLQTLDAMRTAIQAIKIR